MKTLMMLLLTQATLLMACNSGGKNSVEKADSTNQANLDTALNRNAVVIDEKSSEFLVRVANSGMAEAAITGAAQDNAVYADVKSLAAMLYHDHSALNEQVKALAGQKNVVLPAVMSEEKQKEVDALQKNTGKNFDREFISAMIKNHEAGIELCSNAMLDTKDPEVRSFADKTLPTLRAHLDSAKTIQKRHW